MDAILRPLKSINYVYLVEIIVILSIVVLLLFIFNALGLLKKPK